MQTRIYEKSEYDHRPGNEFCPGCGSEELRRDIRQFKDGLERDAENEIVAWHYICCDCRDELILLND